MGARATKMRDIVLASLVLAGPFAFVQALLFRPKMLTPYMAGVEGVVPLELQTLAAVLVFWGACVLCRPQRRIFRMAVGIAAALICAFAVVLILSVRVVWASAVVACLLAASGGMVMGSLLRADPFDAASGLADYVVSALVSLCASSFFVHGSYAFSENDAHGTVMLAVLMGAAALLWAAMAWSGGAEEAGRAEGRPLAAAPEARERLRDVLRTVAPVMPAGFICAFSLGMASTDPSLEAMLRYPAPFLVGILTCVVVLFACALHWYRGAEEQGSEIILIMAFPSALGLLAVLLSTVVPAEVPFSLLVCSNLLFLAFVWVDVLYLAGRRGGTFSSAPVLCLASVLLLFWAGMAASWAVPFAVRTAITGAGSVAYLVYLVFFADRPNGLADSAVAMGTGAVEGAGPALTYEGIRAEATDALARDFALSPKETEVLPLLVRGLSAAAMGRVLFISHETVKTHKYHIYQKCGVHNFEEFVDLFERYAGEVGGGSQAELSQ